MSKITHDQLVVRVTHLQRQMNVVRNRITRVLDEHELLEEKIDGLIEVTRDSFKELQEPLLEMAKRVDRLSVLFPEDIERQERES